MHFADRTEAGERLVAAVTETDISADLVLAIPRGGLPVGRAVADGMDLPLDIVAAKKLPAPGNPELALGAVASDGTTYRDERMLDHIGPHEAYLERQEQEQQEAAAEKLRTYRETDGPPDMAGKTMLLVDDGVATGSTAIACLRQLRSLGAERVVLAVPVGPPDTVEQLREEADDVICLHAPEDFRAVGSYYDDFEQVTDEEARGFLRDG